MDIVVSRSKLQSIPRFTHGNPAADRFGDRSAAAVRNNRHWYGPTSYCPLRQHRDRAELRAVAGKERVERSGSHHGIGSDADDPRWAGAPDPAIVLDRGDAAQLANAIDAVEHVNFARRSFCRM